MSAIFFYTIITLISSNNVQSKMEGFVVEGDIASIEHFPYSASLGISCGTTSASRRYICGSSIINQLFVLTAGHCVVDCSNSDQISVVIGHEFRLEGVKSSARKFKTHEEYSEMNLAADIALVLLKTPMTLDFKVQRVILMKDPPYQDEAFVAGWGLVNETKRISTKRLMFAQQKVWPRQKCMDFFDTMSQGAFCAGSKKGYAAGGDSGSALVTRHTHLDVSITVQIGLVSYKEPRTPSVVVYMNVSYYLDWIIKTTKEIHCT